MSAPRPGGSTLVANYGNYDQPGEEGCDEQATGTALRGSPRPGEFSAPPPGPCRTRGPAGSWSSRPGTRPIVEHGWNDGSPAPGRAGSESGQNRRDGSESGSGDGVAERRLEVLLGNLPVDRNADLEVFLVGVPFSVAPGCSVTGTPTSLMAAIASQPGSRGPQTWVVNRECTAATPALGRETPGRCPPQPATRSILTLRRILRRSSAVVPAHTPCRLVPWSSANSKHCCRTGHVWQMATAGSGDSDPVGNHVTSGRAWHNARRCHSGMRSRSNTDPTSEISSPPDQF
jgi:hypothetical protein